MWESSAVVSHCSFSLGSPSFCTVWVFQFPWSLCFVLSLCTPKYLHHPLPAFLTFPPSVPLHTHPWALILALLFPPGLEPLAPLTVYAAAGSRVELPCHLPPGVGTSSSLMAKWTPPGGGPERLVAGKNGDFALQLEAVGLEQAGTYSCSVDLQGQWLSTTVTVAVITGQPQVGKEELAF